MLCFKIKVFHHTLGNTIIWRIALQQNEAGKKRPNVVVAEEEERPKKVSKRTSSSCAQTII
jgi:hypothetical protein